ncbi:RNA 2',3'-cyclic phosphodiesterase [Shewanella maritima]|uniref:RNA 2',3'-cyclic phosphodiesterase n=1 Tax=Shewanella maritima TaxID=2520507 RepID=A0A411PFW5_9GAMM|nr:RNA 2',3'-cyclic phosphodiesterase [Shewanella maritima]QBF82354.1 RNA 2',3'-cyclic phosphodiesterase [Shewanella maritima]
MSENKLQNTVKRLFVGFDISASTQIKLRQIATTVTSPLLMTAQPLLSSCSQVPIENMHVTLGFLGQVNQEKTTNVYNSLQSLRGNAFSNDFGQISYWQATKILCIEGSAPPALTNLHRQIQTIAADLELYQSKYEYRPHITLARPIRTASSVTHADIEEHLNQFNQQLHPIKIEFDQLHLYQSLNVGQGRPPRYLKLCTRKLGA